MKKIFNFLFSMTFMGALLLSFALSMAIATFIENDFGTPIAQQVIYNSWWFEGILLLLVINFIANIFRSKLYAKAKWSLLLFHSAFILILIGAGITRYISFEGILHIREGKSVHTLLIQKPILKLSSEGETIKEWSATYTGKTFKTFTKKIILNGKEIAIHFSDFIPNAKEQLMPSDSGKAYISFSIMTGEKIKPHWLIEKEPKIFKSAKFLIGTPTDSADFLFFQKGNIFYLSSTHKLEQKNMQTQKDTSLTANTPHPIVPDVLYSSDSVRFVVTRILPHADIQQVSTGAKETLSSINVLKGNITYKNQKQDFILTGSRSAEAKPKTFTIGGEKLSLAYGLKAIPLPFSLKLKDFQLERYPGSGSPSSYASLVQVDDKSRNKFFEYHIFMNHVLDYRGYRFFQSSYDMDEKGSILSVNHDGTGTFFTYIGYLLMAIGMFWSLANPSSRFRQLIKSTAKLHKQRTAGLLFFLFSFGTLSVKSQEFKPIPKEQANHFGQIYVQAKDGRVKTINVLSSEILRKMCRKATWDDLNANQVFEGILIQPKHWSNIPIIRISDTKVREYLGLKDKYARFSDVVNLKTGEYKLRQVVNTAYAKAPGERNKFDKEIIKADERINIYYLIYVGNFLAIFPNPDKPGALWSIPGNPKFHSSDSLYNNFVQNIFGIYNKATLDAMTSGNWAKPDSIIELIKAKQKEFGASIMPDDSHIKAENFYIKAQIFERLFPWYGTIGMILLILIFIQILAPKIKFKYPVLILVWALFLMFAAHTFGLGLRWYVSGHAPWSNGYEAMIYISWVLMLAGITFSGKSKMGLAATAILSSIMLLVAHLNWMDPTITNLVPVLKSYWLSIHVSIITASYGFLGLSSLLGLLVLLLMSFQTPQNAKNLRLSIKELTQVNEMSLIVGLYLLTIGTFLGGVWANESWGRYWGWDPKETWALISVIVYSFVAHMRLIPGLKSHFALNFSAMWSYWIIMMTFFGVNFYLSGMHSYAKGDPVPIPAFVYFVAGFMIILSAFAYWRNKKINKE